MRQRVGAVVALLALVLVGCSSGTSVKGPQDAVQAAATKTLDQGSSKVSLDTVVSGSNPGTFRADGQIDYANRRGTFVLDLGSSGIEGGQDKVDVVFEGNTFYMRFPALQRTVPNSKPWFRVDLDQLSTQVGGDVANLGQLQRNDPRQALAYLRGATPDTKDVGEEKVRGVDTTHYQTTLDLKQARAALPESERRSVDESIRSLGTATIPADVWLDREGRLRRLEFAQDLAKLPSASGASGRQGTVRVREELFDFGTPVEAKPPPAAQVTDLGQLLAQMQQGQPPQQ